MSKKQVLTVPGRYDQIQTVCAFVADGALEAGLTESDLFHIELCCDEACTNIIEHAYGGEDVGHITVSYESVNDAFQITLHDNGRSFNPNAVPKPSLLTANAEGSDADALIDNIQIGGLGIHFIRKLMDDVQFSFDPEQGNRLLMSKQLSSEEG